MSQYYFHLRDHDGGLLDPQGLSIDDPQEIGAIALREVRALIAQDVLQGRINLDQRLEVEDSGGNVVHCLHFSDAVQISEGRQ